MIVITHAQSKSPVADRGFCHSCLPNDHFSDLNQSSTSLRA
jgi:hypothetical protein